MNPIQNSFYEHPVSPFLWFGFGQKPYTRKKNGMLYFIAQKTTPTKATKASIIQSRTSLAPGVARFPGAMVPGDQ
jgi:hypothetical protein